MTDSIIRTAQPPLSRSWRGLAAGALSALSGVALLATSAYLITRAAEQPPILYLSIAIVSVRLFSLTRAVFRYLERLLSHDAAFRQLATVRTTLYRRLVRVAPAGLGRTSRGDLLSRVVSDVDALQDLPLRVVQPLVISGLSALAAVVAVLVFSPAAGVVLLAGLVIAFGVGCLVATVLARRSERDLAGLRGDLSAAILDTVQNLDVLVAFDAVDAQLQRMTDLDSRLRTVALTRASTSGVVTALIALVSGATVLGAIAAAAPTVGHGLLGPELALVALVPLAVFEVVGAVPVAVLAWRKVRASAARVDTAAPAEVPAGVVLDDDSDDAAAPEPLGLGGPGAVALRLSGVAATWPGAGVPALPGLDLEVAVGERIVVEGPSGAGKSTLASVLVRFVDYSGSYEIGGVDARSVRPADARATVGLLEQTPYVFDENVRQNLLFARDTSTDAELEAVLARVGLGEWLESRGGLDARPGERGALISGGQAQRLALARALLRGFPVLVLDEPAAGVDPDLADALLADLLRAAEADGTTVVLISHVPVPSALVTRRLRLVGGRFA
ncbi:ATP-binding cassette subfamily C protein CydC [Frondihabitans sp. PhB188]|uniref:thiol reductant ABC exporter subunit CydC n=1 Tax=Frondihabitans sp. PhB188 TaxID=2485200 RepID=UPI000F474862|nr:thiol reductant ABC exporter subunit CydC [Frondihabitans sp. PhB188]ROQ41217.1 ATP-binding cassette subfamily C protein CydC [Frondihabitans sp. PhB188]